MSHIQKRTAALAALPLALALLLTGCDNGGNLVAEPNEPAVVDTLPAEPEPEPTEPEPVVTEQPDNYPARWPLTGVGTDSVPDRPALLVKVENSSLVRGTQRGLQEADVLYEILVEGGITRYVAVYNSQLPDEIMPVRSARESDIPIITPYGGVFAFSGAQQPFITALNAAGNQLLQEGIQRGFSRFAGRPAPHNVLADPVVLLEQANSTRVSPPQGGMPFALDVNGSSAAEEGAPINTIDVRMSNAQRSVFRWDAQEGKFMRFDGENPSVLADGSQIGATNVILVSAPYSNSTLPGVGGDVPTARLSGSGRAAFAADGKYLEGTWQKGGNADPFTFLDANGQPVVFAPGNTFVEIVPEMAGGWSFQ